MNFRKAIIFILGAAAIGWGVYYSLKYFTERADEGMTFDQAIPAPVVEEEQVIEAEPVPVPEIIPEVSVAAKPRTWPDVPFISQAPTGEWARSEFQNGCEEASALMVAAWRTGKTYTPATAKQVLIAMARFQEKVIGQGVDTDVADTAEILLRDYFDIADYEIVYDFTLDDLKRALAEGLVIVPTDGQTLKNPNFTQPGPLQHMLVITGYDAATQEFITNDPGTRKGAGYRYPEATLYAAIREYPTGNHLPIKTERKAMILVPALSIP
ncbi:MAG: C39 family peptidase [Candidatus Moraniibacteriota bacterium]